MKIHEYQAKNLFSSYGIPVEKYVLCNVVDEAVAAYDRLAIERVVVKAQVLTGGRGKAGGVKLAKNREDVFTHANAILGMNIKEFPVTKIIVSQAVNIGSEYYVSFVIDRNTKTVILMMSAEGGMDIEEVAKHTPEKIHRFSIDPFIGIPDYLARRFAFCLFDEVTQVNQMADILQKLYNLFIDKDASLAEINPLVLTHEGNLIAIDAKMTFDDNALYRQPQIQALFEPTEEEKTEAYAKEKGFSYVHLDGEIGCMVNGAGLAMATMDMIKLYGGTPANFLDIGGSSNPNKVIDAMTLLLKDPQVKVVLINIFGGITRCDDVASGLLTAFEQLKTDIPVIVRLTGTNEKEGREMLKGTRFKVAETMGEAVQLAVNSK
ncbi:ADP-forming succinate--CoA ligase subunit beta [Dysgonomonas sp. Marseille-P4677]|uniref:ADP-forming succinate--CoA ligase subunit beta n=1 Tax=Dysgonomonas sp. Marseille-P4677 TaxID=2364790 RepID=UPI0019126077|nr:ADP-forming succinate--CoA ligase subunit beta [Dysgonomonas sp. Marseille-P4677]MBK5721872.1 ADP-forming succinate--CoA ligase subunit beta [Dysgonomonas sp. Marseille-P4677]